MINRDSIEGRIMNIVSFPVRVLKFESREKKLEVEKFRNYLSLLEDNGAKTNWRLVHNIERDYDTYYEMLIVYCRNGYSRKN